MIQNPKKEITLPKPISEVLVAVGKLSKYTPTYTLNSNDTLLNQFKFSTGLFAGNYNVVIDVSAVNENSTKVTIEISKQFGAIDQPYEVMGANQHIQGITDAVSYIIQNPNDDFADRNAEREKTASKGGKILKWIGIAILAYIVIAVVMAIAK